MLNSAEHDIFSANKYENASRPRGYKTFFMLNSAEHEIFSAEKFSCSTMFSQKEFAIQLLVIRDLLAGKISCSVELSMKKVL